MPCKASSFFTFTFLFTFCSFLAVHYAVMKTPSPWRGIASQQETLHPLYQASFKL
jgi:hypothetical protein